MISSGESDYNMALAFGLGLKEVSRRKAVHRRSALFGRTLLRRNVRWSAAEEQILCSAIEQRLSGPKLWNLLSSAND